MTGLQPALLEHALVPSPQMTLRLFGAPKLLAAGLPVRLSSRRAFHLLGRIALLRGAWSERRMLVDTLWPELDFEASLTALRRELYRIDAAWTSCGNTLPLIERDGRALRLNPGVSLSIDVLIFEAALHEGRPIDAVACYTAPLLEGFDDVEISRERTRLALRYCELLEHLIAEARREDRLCDAIAFAQRLEASDPYREQTIRTLMQLQCDAGDRAAAIRTFQKFEAMLASELGAKPLPSTAALHAKISNSDYASALRQRLPGEVSSLFGRERDLTKIATIFERRSLITITGPPGMGKSRLALRVAYHMQSTFGEDVYFADLTRAVKPADVERIVADALQWDPTARGVSLESLIADRMLLIILDNCEHLTSDVLRLVMRVFAASKHAKILATSRRPLRHPAEVEWRLESLAPAAAADLFLERAAAVLPGKSTKLSEHSVGAICALLDGVPLALELAASRLRLTTIEELERMLAARLPVLAGETRGATASMSHDNPYSWSYEMLSADAQAVFRQLAVFVGGFSLDAASAVCGMLGTARSIAAISELVEHSMIVSLVRDGEPTRYKLLFSAHEFALERLTQHAEAAAARSRHARYMVEWAVSQVAIHAGPRREHVYPELRREYPNLVAALEETVVRAADVEAGLRACVELDRFWTDASANGEALRFIEIGLPQVAQASELAAKAMLLGSVCARLTGNVSRAIDFARNAVACFSVLGDARAEISALVAVGNASTVVRDFDTALAVGAEALAIADTIGTADAKVLPAMMLAQAHLSLDAIAEARSAYASVVEIAASSGYVREAIIALNNLAVCALFDNDVDEASTYASSALERGRALMLPENVAWALHVLSSVAWRRGDVRSGLEFGEEVVTAARMTNARILEIRLLEDIAAFVCDAGDAYAAAQMVGAADAARRWYDQPLQPIEEAAHARFDEALQSKLGPARLTVARTMGALRRLEDAVAYALHTARASSTVSARL